MTWTAKKLFVAAALCCLGLAAATTATAQTSATTASPFVPSSSGAPSTIQLKRQMLALQQAQIEGELRQAQLCVKNATILQTLRDPQGNINRVPQTDLVDCARRIRSLERQMVSLGRQAEALARDAEAQGLAVERRLRRVERQQRILTGQTPGL